MKVFVSVDGDAIGNRVGRAILTDDVEEVRRVDRAIIAGNELFMAFCERSGGTSIESGGDECRFELPAEHLSELEGIRQQYAQVVGATASVGVGTKLSESAKALMVAKLRGKDQILLWAPEMQAELDAVTEKPEDQKIAEEYLNKAISQESPQAEDFEQHFHAEASKQHQLDQNSEEEKGKRLAELKAQLVEVLGIVRDKSSVIAQLKEADPQAYVALMELVQGVIALGREVLGDDPVEKPSAEPMTKEELDPSSEEEEDQEEEEGEDLDKGGGPIKGVPPQNQLILPVGSQVNDRLKIRHADGETAWTKLSSGMVQGQEADSPVIGMNSHPVPARQQGAR